MAKLIKHLMIPDTQVHPGVNTDHIEALGNYIAEKRPDVIVMIGDWFDMPSLSSYDRPGDKGWELKDLDEDIESGIDAMNRLVKGFRKISNYDPKMVFTLGNHEYRMTRVAESADGRKFKKYLQMDNLRLKDFGWKVVPFLNPISINGIHYCHYFCNPDSLYTNPMGGQIQTRLRKLNVSFSMGHQQLLMTGEAYNAAGKRIRGVVAGAFYSHDEDYLGPQKNRQYWRGVIMKHEVRAGNYDLMEVSLNYLTREYL